MEDVNFTRVPAEYREQVTDLANFIQASPTSYQCAAEISRRLESAGFNRLDERQAWNFKNFTVDGLAGGTISISKGLRRYYVQRDGAVIAWVIPARINPQTVALRVVGSHTDSPALKLKPRPGVTNYGWQQIGMEIYGGPLINSFIDRDIGLAGRLTTLDGQEYLVQTEAILRVSQLAPHLDRSVNDNLHLDRQAHLLPIYSVSNPDLDVIEHLCALAKINKTELAGYDVYSYDTQAPQVLGMQGEFLATARLDNLSSVHASLWAFLQLHTLEAVEQGEQVAVLAAFDHEEIGSATRSGACGPFLADVISRMAEIWNGSSPSELAEFLARSSCISADAGHSIHPNYPNHHDPNNQPLVNAGSLLKINANQRYATDASGAALWHRACANAGVPTQDFVSNNAVPCGSTIGPLTATRLGMLTVDVGVPLLSMHSMRELCGTADGVYLAKALGSYWSCV